ncbi:MAG: hypothetical protein J6M25_00165 [Prevotella sp.]|nr:hypothetical protein [Prevotella sp.]
MKRLHIERFYLNRLDDEYPMTVRITLRLRDAVDEGMLREALEATRQRYPYLCVRLGVVRDDDLSEHYVYEDNPKPWVLSAGQQSVRLFGDEANGHLLAFAWWDDCVALDFSHVLIDGDAAYRLLRTLLNEYCRRHYDEGLSRKDVWVAGDDISPEEYTDPATLPRPEKLAQPSAVQHPQMQRPRVVNLSTEAVSPIAERKETVLIRLSEDQMMERVWALDATPATLLALLLTRAIARLHADSVTTGGIPTVCVAANLRRALGVPLAHHSMVGGLFLPLSSELAEKGIVEQVQAFRQMVAAQASDEQLQAYFWQTQERMDRMELLPTLRARYEAFAPVNTLMGQMASCMLSYVGKARLGTAEQYVREMVAEADSAYMLVLEVSAAAGRFTISFTHRFATDAYLDAFLDELRALGLTPEVADRHPLHLAPITDYRNNKS